jgi:hypothetical protein
LKQDAGNVLNWFVENFIHKRNINNHEFEVMNEYAQEIEPGAEGLYFLHFWAEKGARFTIPMPEALFMD